jgi:lysophospholipase L1-like esterase
MKFLILPPLMLLGLMANARHAAASPPEPTTPKILLVGDSIRDGYTPFVKKLCEQKALVISGDKFGQRSDEVLDHLNLILAEKPDIVHFNCGLRDLAVLKSTGRAAVPVDKYGQNLEKIVKELHAKSSARLIFATTTPVIDSRHAKRIIEFDRYDGDVKRYNAVALKVMKATHVEIDDLNASVRRHGVDDLLGNDGVHYLPNGYQELGKAVAAAVLKPLAKGE